MALMICQECGGKVSSRASACPHCGCPIEANTIDIVGMSTDEVNSAVRFLSLARSALSAGNGQEAYDYAKRILEMDPHNIDALDVKMRSLEYIGTLSDIRIPEVIEAGKKILELTHMEDEENAVYTHFLNRAAVLLEIAIDKMRDVDTIRSLARLNFRSANSTDSVIVTMLESVVNGVMLLKVAVPKHLIEKSDTYQSQVMDIAKLYKKYTYALRDRYSIYYTEPTDQTIARQKAMLEVFAAGLPSPEEMKERYWAAHAEEKRALESQRQEYMEKRKEILDRISSVKVFDVTKRWNLRTELTEIDQVLSECERKLDRSFKL